MPDYRDIKDPTRLSVEKLTDEEKATVEAGGNEAAAGVEVPGGNPQQLNIWWKADKTLVMPYPADKEKTGWSLTGYISPDHVRAEYMARVHPAPEPKEEPTPEPEPDPTEAEPEAPASKEPKPETTNDGSDS